MGWMGRGGEKKGGGRERGREKEEGREEENERRKEKESREEGGKDKEKEKLRGVKVPLNGRGEDKGGWGVGGGRNYGEKAERAEERREENGKG